MRYRLINKDEQNHFAKEHYKLGSSTYLTDFDALSTNDVYFETENEIYSQYVFKDSNAYVKKFIEIKYCLSDYIKSQIKKKVEPNGQTLIIASITNEINFWRNETDKVEFLMVIQENGDYPYLVFSVTSEDNEIKYHYKGKCENEEEYINFFK